MEEEFGTCAICGRWTGSYTPKGADGTMTFPRKHKVAPRKGWCAGSLYSTVQTADGAEKQAVAQRLRG